MIMSPALQQGKWRRPERERSRLAATAHEEVCHGALEQDLLRSR